MADETTEMLKEITAECLEHTARMESLLLGLEETAGHTEPELINDLFRSAHSIKGVVGFCGLSKIKDVAHSFENVLGAIRKRELTPNAQAVDVMLRTNDFLKELLNDAARSNEADIGPYVRDLDGLLLGDVTPVVPKVAPKPPQATISDGMGTFTFRVDAEIIAGVHGRGHNLYILHMDLVRDAQEAGRTPGSLLQDLEGLGEIHDTCFDIEFMSFEGSAEKPGAMPLGVLYSSLIGPDMIGSALGLPAGAWEMVPAPEGQAKPTTTARTVPISVAESAPQKKPTRPDPVVETSSLPRIMPTAPREIETVASPEYVVEPLAEDTPAAEAVARADGGKTWQPENSLRVNVALLDNLMNLAGELVLARNQLMQTVDASRLSTVAPVAQRVNLVTSELQAQIMQTRMQALNQVFSKFPRLVRDLSRKLNKEVELIMEGREVELDKAIVEELGDPLVHLFRNAVDHGIEPPADRVAAGKPRTGKVWVRAYHEAGQVNIEIQDDGRGMDPKKLKDKAVRQGLIRPAEAAAMTDRQALDLIFRAGFSTAEQISDVSGRGVGMDVVRASLERLGGTLDLQSELGQGSTMRIKLPLTMAIIPSLILRVAQERYAIPQLSLVELVRVNAREVKDRIERVGGAEVLRLRDNFLPLIRLAEVLQVSGYFRDPLTNELKVDRRQMVADRRAGETPESEAEWQSRRSGSDRRQAIQALNIVVLAAGDMQYGLIVDELQDTEEIVVKPFGRHLKEIPAYAGATIMGDGKVAPILDVLGLAQHANLFTKGEAVKQAVKDSTKDQGLRREMEKVLLFCQGPEHVFAVPISLVSRAIRINGKDIESTLGRPSIQQRGQNLRLVFLDKHLPLPPLDLSGTLFIVVFEVSGQEIGLVASALLDEKLVPFELDTHTHVGPGIMGSLIIDGRTAVALDVFELVDLEEPSWTKRSKKGKEALKPRILLVEDSDFFRDKIGKYLIEAGYDVLTAINGAEGLAVLDQERVDLVLTDIEMPVMNGLEMVRKIRARSETAHMKIVALSSLAGDDDVRRGLAAGVDHYQIKLDREALLAKLAQMISGAQGR